MSGNVDTLVYQLEDENADVRLNALQKLRKVAAVEESYFPVRNVRRFLHAVRRRILSDNWSIAFEALLLVQDVMSIIGGDASLILSSILPHLVPKLPSRSWEECRNIRDEDAPVQLHDETFTVFEKYINVAGDLEGVTDLMVNIGMANDDSYVREASLMVVLRLVEDKFAHTRQRSATPSVLSKADQELIVFLIQATVPMLEDEEESVVVAAEEVVAKLQVHWGGEFEKAVGFLSAEDRQTLAEHREPIRMLYEAAWTTKHYLHSTLPQSISDRSPPDSRESMMSATSELTANSTTILQFGFVPQYMLNVLVSETCESHLEDSERRKAIEQLLNLCRQTEPAVIGDLPERDIHELLSICCSLFTDDDINVVTKSLDIVEVIALKCIEYWDLSKKEEIPALLESVLPYLVKLVSRFGEDHSLSAHANRMVRKWVKSDGVDLSNAVYALVPSLREKNSRGQNHALRMWIVLLLADEGANHGRVHFTLPKDLSGTVGELLVDIDDSVRGMAYELIVTLGCIHQRKIVTALESVLDEEVLDQIDTETLTQRIHRKQSPKLCQDGSLMFFLDEETCETFEVDDTSAVGPDLVCDQPFLGMPTSGTSNRKRNDSTTSNRQNHKLNLASGVREDEQGSPRDDAFTDSEEEEVLGNDTASAGVPLHTSIPFQVHASPTKPKLSRRLHHVDEPCAVDAIYSPQKLQEMESEAASKSFTCRDNFQGNSPIHKRNRNRAHGDYFESHEGDGRGEMDESAPEEIVITDRGTAKPKRPISLATRKRLEAKQKQQAAQLASDKVQEKGANISTSFIESELPPKQRISYKMEETRDTVNTHPSVGGEGIEIEECQKKRPLRRRPVQMSTEQKEFSNIAGKQDARYLEDEELTAVTSPKDVMSKLLPQLQSDDWEVNFNALTMIRRLAHHHPMLLRERAHIVCTEVIRHVTSLRSSVCKNGFLALNAMCSNFGKTMDQELGGIIPVLLKRSADSNAFVCEAASTSIQVIIQSCSSSKYIPLLTSYASSRAVAIRKEVARSIRYVFERISNKVRIGQELSPALLTVGKMLEDANQDVRALAKAVVVYLHATLGMKESELKEVLPTSSHGKLHQILQTATISSLQRMDTANNSTKRLVTNQPSTRASSQPAKKNMMRGTSSAGRKVQTQRVQLSSSEVEEFEDVQKRLENNNWEVRYKALQDATKLVEDSGPGLCSSSRLLPFFDAIIKRTEDGNSKVNMLALESMIKMMPVLGSTMEVVLPPFLTSIVKNVASSNTRLSELAKANLQSLCTHADERAMCQHLSVAIGSANVKTKPFLVSSLAGLTQQCDEKLSSALTRYVLPVAFNLMKEARADIKEVNAQLLQALYDKLGSSMMQSANKLSSMQQDRLLGILGIARKDIC